MPSNTCDLTQGGILKKLVQVAVPIMGTQLMQMAYNLTDMFWLGRMENSVMAVAASGLAGMFLWLGMALMMVGRMGSEIGTSQNLGRGDRAAARGFAEDSARLSLMLGLFYGLVLVALAGPLVSLLQVKEAEVFENTCAYLRIVGIGIPLTYVSAAITGAFNGAGNSRLGFWANAVGLVVNMALDPLMILVWGWGVAGAAVATVIAQGVVCALFVYFVKRHPRRPFERFRIVGRMARHRVRKILGWSLPVAAESGAFTALAMVVTGMVSAFYGETAVAVQRVGSQIESLSWLIGGGFSSAVTSFVGQNFGAGRWTRIRRGHRISLGALLIWEAAVTLLLVFGGRFFFSLFLPESEKILDMGATYLRILAGCQLFMALEGACAGTFRGMGRTLPPSVCSISSNLIRPLLCYLLMRWMGLNGLWTGIMLSASLRGALMLIWYLIYERRLPRVDEPVGEPSPA
ncbi:MAG: MATE family efflux transporter [Clostridiales bacterium]|jgi:putative MATE family efflux protein|nr:MATE family efflux transporter [Clostridiales bacterium]OPZ67188.1 MAG: Multidrug export protein MepA [Firmicutes bacterium ADurb.Bin467]